MPDSTYDVLILETDNHISRLLTELLEDAGFRVREEMDSDLAVVQVMRQNPAVILMSEDMPPLGTVEILPLVRRLTRVPIIVLGEGGDTPVVSALLEGADMYMSKPLNYRELLSRVRSLTRRFNSDQQEDDSSSRLQSRYDDNFIERLLRHLPTLGAPLLRYKIQGVRWAATH